MTNSLKNTENKIVSEDNQNQGSQEKNNDNDNYVHKKFDEILIGSCGRPCSECKIGDCLNG